ncbi:hypothetical protein BDV12DRAFT_162248 [Aspergillus spectabilis]
MQRAFPLPTDHHHIVTLQAILNLFIWAVFAWLCITRPPLPEITSYPLFDFAFKARLKRDTAGVNAGKDQFYQLVSQGVPPAGVLGASDGDVLSVWSTALIPSALITKCCL